LPAACNHGTLAPESGGTLFFPDSRWQLRGGLANLFDKHYPDHLAGIIRVNDRDVAVGDPIPAAGRFAYVEARVYW
jgi:outer membrane receptor protein involved in Fe transport